MKINRKFFGMHIGKGSKFDSPKTPFYSKEMGYGSIRLWDTYTNWRHLETSKNVWDFSKLDDLVNQALANDLEVTLTLGQAPDWATATNTTTFGSNYNNQPPTNIQDWKDYVTTIMNRYAGKIKAYEIWNEANLNGYWAGTTAQLVQLTKEAYQIIKTIDVNAKVVSASFTTNSGITPMDNYLATGAKDWIDVVACHLYCYPSPPEEMINLAKQYRDIMVKNGVGNLPLWDTESTWNQYTDAGGTTDPNTGNTIVMTDDYAISYLFRMFLANAIAGTERCFFYGMDKPWSVLRLVTDTTNPTTLSAAGNSFSKMVDWLVDAELSNYDITPSGIYYVKVTKGNEKYIIAWADDTASRPLKPPQDMRIHRSYAADGTTLDVNFNHTPLTNVISPLVINKVPKKLAVTGQFDDLNKVYESRYDLAVANVSIGASPHYEQNHHMFPVDIIVQGGTVTQLDFSRNGTQYYNTGLTNGIITLSPNDRLKITYSVIPTVRKIPR